MSRPDPVEATCRAISCKGQTKNLVPRVLSLDLLFRGSKDLAKLRRDIPQQKLRYVSECRADATRVRCRQLLNIQCRYCTRGCQACQALLLLLRSIQERNARLAVSRMPGPFWKWPLLRQYWASPRNRLSAAVTDSLECSSRYLRYDIHPLRL